jgi:hypothetical protein
MKYTWKNAPGATVHDIESRRKIDNVMELDDETGVILVCDIPFRLGSDGEVMKRELKFGRIWPIWAGGVCPVMFHCIGHDASHHPQSV